MARKEEKGGNPKRRGKEGVLIYSPERGERGRNDLAFHSSFKGKKEGGTIRRISFNHEPKKKKRDVMPSSKPRGGGEKRSSPGGRKGEKAREESHILLIPPAERGSENCSATVFLFQVRGRGGVVWEKRRERSAHP